MTRRDLLPPLIAAMFVTGLGALKPAVVDDAAYLRIAEQVASHPFDPYGFEQFWYSRPQPAMKVLAPPVVPYLLALGLQFSGDLRIVKLALFPAVWFLMNAAFDLFRRFAPGRERLGLLLLATSPAVLPMLNAMLDIPAAGFGLAAVALFARACDPNRRHHYAHAIGAGVLAGLAFQTKYSALSIPAVVIWYALPRRRFALVAVAVIVAVIIAASWEVWLHNKYGQSHFLFHAADQASDGTLGERLEQKLSFARPLLNYLGLLGCGWALVAGRAAGLPRWAVRAGIALFTVGLFVLIFGPLDWVRPGREPAAYPRLGFALNLFGISGAATLLTLTIGFARNFDRSRESWFLAGWLLIEIAACLALTPFPAARRVIVVSIVLGFVAMRVVAKAATRDPSLAPGRGVVAYCVGLGVMLAAIDHWDARPEMRLARDAAEVARPGQVWTHGAWGWQYYARHAGFRLAVAGESRLERGDWLVLPTHPHDEGFYRPDMPSTRFDPACLELVKPLVADDGLPVTTLPALYGGSSPMWGRDHARLTVKVYRVTRPTLAMRPGG